jgi:periplasmic protein CpxP/Spy
MKKLMIVAVLASMTLAAQAQEKEKRTPQECAKARTEHMTKELALSPEQQAKVEAINLKYADQVEAMRSEREAERTAKREAAKAMHDAHDAEMKAVLTADQYTKWVAKKQEAKAKHMEKRKQMREERKGN